MTNPRSMEFAIGSTAGGFCEAGPGSSSASILRNRAWRGRKARSRSLRAAACSVRAVTPYSVFL